MASVPPPATYAQNDIVASGTSSKVRVVGSNYTMFLYRGHTIAYLESVQDSGQRALGGSGGGVETIHPLGYVTPTDIVTSRVLDAGTLQLSIRQLWNREVWENMAGLAGTKNIVDIFKVLANSTNSVTCSKIVFPPGNAKPYGKLYHRCVITDIDDSDTVRIGDLSVAKGISIMYTHTTEI